MTGAAATASTATLLALGGVRRSVGGNTPFFLDDPLSAWIVLSGRVEVFSVARADGEAQGTRYHYLTADPGDALFGMDLERYGEGLGMLAVGVVGTELLQVALDRLKAAGGVGDLVERWVSGLSKGVARTIVPQPRADLLIEPGVQGALADGGRVRAHRGVVWISHLSGSSLFLGMEELGDSRREALLPLTHDSFLQALGPVRLAATDTMTALATGEAWAGLETFYDALFRCEFFNTRLAAADELNRLADRTERDRRSRQDAVAGLAAVIERRSAEFADLPGDDPLLAACTAVGRRLGLTVQAPRQAVGGPAAPKPTEAVTDPLGDIVRASRIRMRKVVLKGEWWRQETWPLVGHQEEGGQPVALLPSGPGRFELHDPITRTRKPVTRAVAERLSGVAFMFYRPLPDKPLTARDLLTFGVRGSVRDLLRPLAVGAVAGLFSMVPPFFLGQMVDNVIPENERMQLLQLAGILCVLAVTTASFGVVRQLSVLRLETKMSGAIQPAIWDRLLGLPVAFFRQFSAGDLAQRAACIDAIRKVLSGATTATLMTGIFSLFLLAQLFYYNASLAWWAAGLLVIALAFFATVAALRLRLYRPTMLIEGRISGLVLQLLTGIAKLRVAGAEGRAFAVWAREFARQKRLSLQGGGIENAVQTYNVVFPVVCSMVIFPLVLIISRQGVAAGAPPMSAGDFVAFTSAFAMLLVQMLELGTAGVQVLTIAPLLERAKPLLEAGKEVDATKVDPAELSGRIDVEHVTFRYHPNGPAILHDVSMHVEPGEYVALVGPSGSGKSTLARLLLGLETPERGSIYYDGRDIALLDVQKLRRRIGVVTQAGMIRAGSLFDNIVGAAPLTVDDAWEAVRLAGLEEDLRAMPMGLHTVVQQGGTTLSGGQRQRLMIARAIVHRPRVLIFDEATSALDNRTQAIVTESLERLQASRIAIAHRLSTIVRADRIYVLKEGRVVESGTYEALSAAGGVFTDLIRRQLA
jgi:ATP-binding cassette subfamily C protein